MANRHFGEIGDVWKHLPMAEILSIEKPQHYWESHAGSARYLLAPSMERDYGIFYFMRHASAALRASAYFKLIEKIWQGGKIYPGSPMIAMSLLDPRSADFLFCDIDGESLDTIDAVASEICLRDSSIKTVCGDGVLALDEEATSISDEHAAATCAHIDPYEPFDKSAGGLDSVSLFCRLVGRGIKAVLWYGYDSYEDRDTEIEEVRKFFREGDLFGHNLWCGDVSLVGIDDPTFDVHPGVLGCGIICGNLSEESLVACERLGKEMAETYRDAVFPSGRSGALRYSSIQV